MEKDGTTPAADIVVLVQVKTYYLLSDLTDGNGNWNVNLADLRDPQTNGVGNFAPGDPIEVTAKCGAKGSGSTKATVGSTSPQQIADIICNPIIVKEWTLSFLLGFQIVTLRCQPTDMNGNPIEWKAFDFLNAIPDAIPKAIIRFNCLTQTSEQAFDIGFGPIGTNFSLVPGEGDFVQVSKPVDLTLKGMTFESPIRINLSLRINSQAHSSSRLKTTGTSHSPLQWT